MSSNPELETKVIKKLTDLGIKCVLGGQRYSGHDLYHNWYMVGLTEADIFGELEFSANPVWRINWWKNGKYHRDTGFIEMNFDKFLTHIFKDSIPGVKHKHLDEKLKKIMEDFV